MEHQGQLHGHATNKVDEHSGGVTGAGMGTHGGVGTGGQLQPMKDDHKTDGVLRRSGSSSSSSSSEDDGVGGRRKKGMKEKIKEKLPGGNKETASAGAGAHGHGPQAGEHATGVTGTGTHGAEATGEKKGVMEKIKEKLPGQH